MKNLSDFTDLSGFTTDDLKSLKITAENIRVLSFLLLKTQSSGIELDDDVLFSVLEFILLKSDESSLIKDYERITIFIKERRKADIPEE